MHKTDAQILCLHQGAELYGSDRSFLSAVEALAEEGGSLDVILPSEGELAEQLERIPEVRLSFFDKGILRKRELRNPVLFIWRIFAGWLFYLRRFSGYRVIYINTVVMFSALLAACFYRFSRRRVVCHVREIPGPGQLRFFRALFRLSGMELLYNSNATRDAFGVPGQVIYNGVEADAQIEQPMLAGDDINLLLIGRINQWKGQTFLLDALAEVPAEALQRLRVRIVGSPFEGYEYLLDELSSRIATLGLGERVQQIPFCADPSEHYRWADYVVVPSTQPEPFGRVAIEAFAFGKPVIAAAHGGLVEIVQPHQSGLLFAPGDRTALAHVLAALPQRCHAQYAELSRGARQRFASKFSLMGYKANIRAFFFG
jgi:glycosyltransferase involved in cell wall biosynthesis